jgi:hypothetical protein
MVTTDLAGTTTPVTGAPTRIGKAVTFALTFVERSSDLLVRRPTVRGSPSRMLIGRWVG